MWRSAATGEHDTVEHLLLHLRQLVLNSKLRSKLGSEITCEFKGELTDGGEDACEAEVVDSVEREQVEEKLLLLLLAAQEGVPLVQLPVGKPHTGQVTFK